VEQAQAWWQSVNRAVLQNFGLQQKTIRHAAIHVLAQNLQPVAHVEQFVSAVPALVAIDIGGQGKTVAGVVCLHARTHLFHNTRGFMPGMRRAPVNLSPVK
jgi:hypothetical protein